MKQGETRFSVPIAVGPSRQRRRRQQQLLQTSNRATPALARKPGLCCEDTNAAAAHATTTHDGGGPQEEEEYDDAEEEAERAAWRRRALLQFGLIMLAQLGPHVLGAVFLVYFRVEVFEVGRAALGFMLELKLATCVVGICSILAAAIHLTRGGSTDVDALALEKARSAALAEQVARGERETADLRDALGKTKTKLHSAQKVLTDAQDDLRTREKRSLCVLP
jgi:hypothetical protein